MDEREGKLKTLIILDSDTQTQQKDKRRRCNELKTEYNKKIRFEWKLLKDYVDMTNLNAVLSWIDQHQSKPYSFNPNPEERRMARWCWNHRHVPELKAKLRVIPKNKVFEYKDYVYTHAGKKPSITGNSHEKRLSNWVSTIRKHFKAGNLTQDHQDYISKELGPNFLTYSRNKDVKSAVAPVLAPIDTLTPTETTFETTFETIEIPPETPIEVPTETSTTCQIS